MFRLITAICLLPMLLPVLFVGCQPPQAKQFVDGKRADRLHSKAIAELRAAVTERFGTPGALVASLELPVDFGRIEGSVVGSAAGSHQLRVVLKTDDVSAKELNGLGFVWTSGVYKDAVYELKKNKKASGLKKGETVVADFRVTGFDSSDGGTEGTLSLNFKLQEAAKEGDSFVIIGNRLRKGQQLYLQHCMHCHGYSGDGNGPTAKSLNPLPRDFRLGTFKFKATLLNDKPRREDLETTIKNGIPGTYMPSFLLLDERERNTIIEYIRWLSMRGQFEKLLIDDMVGREFTKSNWSTLVEKGNADHQKALARWQKNSRGRPQPQRGNYGVQRYFKNDFPKWIETSMKTVADEWSKVDAEHDPESKRVVRPMKQPRHEATTDSIARGRALFLSAKVNCARCHGVSARGDGKATREYQQKKSGTYPGPGLFDDWGHKIKPRDLTRGIYRGGRRPIDIYRRIWTGIKGTPMPGFGSLPDAQIWDLVNYVLSIPTERR